MNLRSGEPPCYFGMPQINTNAATRLSAYCEAMERLNAEPRVIPISDATTWDFERFAFEEANRLLENLDQLPSRTILCANDRLAFGVIAASWQRG